MYPTTSVIQVDNGKCILIVELYYLYYFLYDLNFVSKTYYSIIYFYIFGGSLVTFD